MINNHYTNNAGWDIGGAHVKLAYIKENSLCVYQWDCPLWKGLYELDNVLKQAFKSIPTEVTNHHVTMTGELVDIFHSRDDGVKKIMHAFLEHVVDQDQVKFFSHNGLVTQSQVIADTNSVASANWIASGRCISRVYDNAIFIDVGSTTTDILSINNGSLELNGLTDFERLRAGELVYTGVVRSCVNTICNEIPYCGDIIPLIAENFAVSADVYRILDWLPAHADYGNTMDGQPKNIESSMRRLARMIGKDYRKQDADVWKDVAQYIAKQQMQMISKSIKNQLHKYEGEVTIIGAGVGRFLIEKIAKNSTIPYQEFTKKIIPSDMTLEANAADCAPAIALLSE